MRSSILCFLSSVFISFTVKLNKFIFSKATVPYYVTFRRACEAEARHRYCFSGVVIGGVGIGSVNFVEFPSLALFLSNCKG